MKKFVLKLALITLIIFASCKSKELNSNSKKGVSFKSDLPEVKTNKMSSGHILVWSEVNDLEGWFIFDSGASVNVLSTHVREKLNLKKGKQVEVEGSGTTQTSNYWLLDKLVLGPAVFTDTEVIDTDLSMLEKAWGVEIYGIIGYSCLKSVVVEIDFNKPTISVFDPTEYSSDNIVDWKKAHLENGQLIVDAQFEGHDGKFRIDAGSDTNGIIHSPTVKRFSMLENRNETNVKAIGLDNLELKSDTLETFTIWGKTYKNLQFNFSTAKEGALASDDVTGNIGIKILKNYILILDYFNQRYSVKEIE